MIEFKKFKDEVPKPGKWVLVTDNIDLRSEGEMANLWLVRGKDIRLKLKTMEYFAYGRRIIHNLTHWKYALEDEVATK